ncbi:hypothetical protein BBP40_010030 [Aspergillus hancockii]|nr:hypothetical protein BBP40_010030 [Aspergillus hancockii]
MPFKELFRSTMNEVAQQRAAQNQEPVYQPNISAQRFVPPQQQDFLPSTMPPGFSWGSLITQSNQPTQLFTRLLDAIFNYLTSTPPVNPSGFDPIKYSSVFAALMYSDNNNPVRRYFTLASQNHFPSPENFVNDAMTIYYRTNYIHYTKKGTIPVLSREGFHTTMLRDTLGDPDVQWRRFNAFLATHGIYLLDPMTGQAFPILVIPRTSFPAGRDQRTWERQAQMNQDFNEELSDYLADLKGLNQQVHDDTMASMSSGAWVYGDMK